MPQLSQAGSRRDADCGSRIRPENKRNRNANVCEQGSEAELASDDPGADREFREADGGIDEELARVVPGLAMDVDGALVVGGPGVVEPPVVTEPAVAIGDEHEVARTRVVEIDKAAKLTQDITGEAIAGRKIEAKTSTEKVRLRTV